LIHKIYAKRTVLDFYKSMQNKLRFTYELLNEMNKQNVKRVTIGLDAQSHV